MLVFSSFIIATYLIVSLLFQSVMLSWPDFSIYADFSPLLSADIWSTSHFINLLLQALVFSLVFIFMTTSKVTWLSGLRFGMSVGSLCLIVCLSGLMPKIGATPVSFITESLTSLCGLQFLRFMFIGLISGWLYQQYLQGVPRLRQLWI
ncbi:hypothetical protein [Marinicella sp. W31]|uniref:hypothetical protein n=1 Tax=Marinicella sp. W31 TaxID=3023713 RepID=UPI0037571AAA